MRSIRGRVGRGAFQLALQLYERDSVPCLSHSPTSTKQTAVFPAELFEALIAKENWYTVFAFVILVVLAVRCCANSGPKLATFAPVKAFFGPSPKTATHAAIAKWVTEVMAASCVPEDAKNNAQKVKKVLEVRPFIASHTNTLTTKSSPSLKKPSCPPPPEDQQEECQHDHPCSRRKQRGWREQAAAAGLGPGRTRE